MSQNKVRDVIVGEIQHNGDRFAEEMRELFDYLDTLDLSREEKNTISSYANKMFYFGERRGLQKGVESVNNILSAVYTSCRSSQEYHYWQYNGERVLEQGITA
jgi:hypothetical protein